VEIRDLDYFLACGKTGSFTAAVADGHAGPVPVPVDDPRLRWNLSAAISASPPAHRGHDRRPPRAQPGSARPLTRPEGLPTG
jgi:hypothetical protein